MKQCAFSQSDPRWLDWRKDKIGGSEIGSLMGLNPYCSPRQLYRQKIGLEIVEMTEKMRIGKEKEKEAFDKFVGTQKNWRYQPNSYVHHDLDFLISSLDGVNWVQNAAVEIKVGKSVLQQAKKGIVPNYYYPQLQNAFEVCGLDLVYFFAYWDKDHATIEVKRDQPFIDRMLIDVNRFYNDWMDLREPSYPEGILGEDL